ACVSLNANTRAPSAATRSSYTEGAHGLRPVTPTRASATKAPATKAPATKAPPTKAPATKAPAHEGAGQESTGPRGPGFWCLRDHLAGVLYDLLEGGRRHLLRALARLVLGRDGQDVQLVRPGALDLRVRPRATGELEGAVPDDRQQAGPRVEVLRGR